MKIHYDTETDAVYLEFGSGTPDGVVELSEDVNLDTTPAGEIVGIEILNASKRVNLESLLSCSMEFDAASIGK